ncbi:hypothetical protein MVEN_00931900 [Mycena venus]|uniref:Novel STAND NTPase 1 domain-containing protein n=1 Tax=Mycena venus TaxID=2733690 RepID=A0A8H6YBN9_9AGAR|nr:hypothetical protein MVEN_00931900 [Mycena venus]
MPPHSSVPSERWSNIVNYLTLAASTLNELCDALGTPFLKAISQMTMSLVGKVESVKRNKDDCLTMMEQIHQILYAIIRLHITSDTGGALPPSTLENMGKFTETLQKIHVFVEAQDGSRIKHFFRQGERALLLKQCNAGLEESLVLFRVQTGSIATDAAELQQTAQQTHETLLELISNLSEETRSSRTSFTNESLFSYGDSSASLEMLPSKPTIFHGREAELEQIVNILDQPSPRIAILGAGGMGKTNLARVVLHHSTAAAKYPSRIFVLCDSTRTGTEIASLIGSHLGLKPGANPAQSVVQYLSRGPPCLLFLDNLETSWEPLASRNEVEDFLALLSAVSHVGLIITMRGAERPAKVHWTRPFLRPLERLTNENSRKIFIDIADGVHDAEDMDQVLSLTDNMPLAVSLVAHVVDSEGCAAFLSRWKDEKTSMLSAGLDRKSNLDISISLSLSSPRMISSPGARSLLSLLSILPDGISDADLLQSNLPIRGILTCKATLLRTSLAYADQNQRLRVLVPIREYIENAHPPALSLIQPLRTHLQELLELCTKYHGLLAGGATVIHRVTSNIGNLQNILLLGLNDSACPTSKTL